MVNIPCNENTEGEQLVIVDIHNLGVTVSSAHAQSFDNGNKQLHRLTDRSKSGQKDHIFYSRLTGFSYFKVIHWSP